MSLGVDSITRICLKSSPDYLPRIRKIAACMAESVGMNEQEVGDTSLVLDEACSNAIRHGSVSEDDQVYIVLRASRHTITADITDHGGRSRLPDSIRNGGAGLGIRLMRMLADKVQFIRHRRGVTVRLTKRARCARRYDGRRPSAAERN